MSDWTWLLKKPIERYAISYLLNDLFGNILKNRVMDDQHRVVEVLNRSKFFLSYASAFEQATKIRLCLEGIDSLQEQYQSSDELQIISKSNGLYYGFIPVREGSRIIAVIRTNLLFEAVRKTETPTNHNSENVFSVAANSTTNAPEISKTKAKAFLGLVVFFAQHLGVISNQLMIQRGNCEPAMVVKARQYIHEHLQDGLSLEEVARHANICSFYLCKVFKKTTGLNFSNYILRLRVEAAKELLLKGNLRINEAALEAGFQSLANFNRAFKKFTGESPKIYRQRGLHDMISNNKPKNWDNPPIFASPKR